MCRKIGMIWSRISIDCIYATSECPDATYSDDVTLNIPDLGSPYDWYLPRLVYIATGILSTQNASLSWLSTVPPEHMTCNWVKRCLTTCKWIQLAVGPQPLWLRNHNSGLAHRIMVKRLATSPHDPLGITDSSCKNQLAVVSVQYGSFNPYIPIRSTTIGKSRVAIDPIAMRTSWRSNSDIASVTSIGYPRMSASGESSTTMHRILHASGSHPIPTPYDPNFNTFVVYEVATGRCLNVCNDWFSLYHVLSLKTDRPISDDLENTSRVNSDDEGLENICVIPDQVGPQLCIKPRQSSSACVFKPALTPNSSALICSAFACLSAFTYDSAYGPHSDLVDTDRAFSSTEVKIRSHPNMTAQTASATHSSTDHTSRSDHLTASKLGHIATCPVAQLAAIVQITHWPAYVYRTILTKAETINSSRLTLHRCPGTLPHVDLRSMRTTYGRCPHVEEDVAGSSRISSSHVAADVATDVAGSSCISHTHLDPNDVGCSRISPVQVAADVAWSSRTSRVHIAADVV
ncbi:hypothetical protein F511_15263 [Dorcoceras hygrometricum]|uniref:Uncharacterized protein n=1 Tax=Dorcoceras hygrometricum TaxID=472368 RepID=A0A2Z7BIB8_9LAMI|nr:hypothetical protein F511_15263 [Dorcoceras hygrometricum]